MVIRRNSAALVSCLVGVAMVLAACSGGTSAPPPAPAAIGVPVANGKPINPTTPIVVDATGGELTAVTVTNAAGKKVDGKLDATATHWTTSEDLGYGGTYTVDATAVNSDKKPTTKSFTVTTITPDDTAYANVVPAPDVVSDVGIGVGQPMVFQFTKPVKDKAEVTKHLKVTTTPAQPGAWYWIDDQNVHYRGPEYWKPGTKIHIEADVYGVDLGGGVYGAEDNAVDYTVHDSWVAKADGATELLTVFHNGEQVKQMPMSLGEPNNPSHTGPHVVSEKAAQTVMDSCTFGVCQGDPGYYRETVYNDLRISNDGEFVHSAPWSVGQQGASNVSHGCVNLSPADSQWMFDHFGLGDVVEITNSGGPPLPVWDTYGDWELSWDQWKAGNT
ncbi:L,D-transpeptidase [Gordonia cholesterolivorans]|uniref:Ig-like domain-containing protein n=1 Tax=Gordonia cholesterolivorans TaxID=559625 RepID=A0ABN3H528_9ACTN